MKNCLIALVFLLFNMGYLHAQISPAEGRVLNYRIVGFAYPDVQDAAQYTLEIAKGNFDGDEDLFAKNIVKKVSCKDKKVIAELPYWGTEYTWRVSFTNPSGVAIKSPFHSFSTGWSEVVDTNKVRVRVLQNDKKYSGNYFFLDHNRALYDMSGKAVWYLPLSGDSSGIRDLKLSPVGTITFINSDKVYEVDYDGNVLWAGPDNGAVSGDTVEHYHHEFTRLGKGHYMVLGDEATFWNFDPPLADKTVRNVRDYVLKHRGDPGVPPLSHFGTLIEYDEKGNVVWSWKSSKYFKASDFMYDNPIVSPSKNAINVHCNAFYFDEKEGAIYMGFKNISRVIKIKYPEGNVIDVYGTVYKKDGVERANTLFCHEHSIGRSSKGYLYVFNNNVCHPDAAATILMMKEEGKEQLRKVWEFACPTDTEAQQQYSSGGNVIELADHSLFACTGMEQGKVFIVDMEKKIHWCAIGEKWDPDSKKWERLTQYRSSIIWGENGLEKLVWHDRNHE